VIRSDNTQSSNILFTVIIAIPIVAAFICISIYYVVFNDHVISDKPENWGVLGDFFGGVLNPVFSFAAIIALLYTIRLQLKELNMTRIELEKSSVALANQHKEMLDARSLQTFKYFLRRFAEVRDRKYNLIDNKDIPYVDADPLFYLLHGLVRGLYEIKENNNLDGYFFHYQEILDSLAPYTAAVDGVLKFIRDSGDLSSGLMSLFRAHITATDKALIFMLCERELLTKENVDFLLDSVNLGAFKGSLLLRLRKSSIPPALLTYSEKLDVKDDVFQGIVDDVRKREYMSIM
jgi:hypothetical protein